MNELTKLRLARVLKRYGPGDPGVGSRDDAAFLAAFSTAREERLVPVLEEFRRELARSRVDARVVQEESERGLPRVVLLALAAPSPARPSRDTIAFTVQERPGANALEVMATLELVGSPMDLGRFERPEDLTREVLERVVLDALEQLLACAKSAVGAGSQQLSPSRGFA